MEKLREFWDLILDVWNNGVMGVDVGHIAAAIATFYAFLLVRGLITRFLMGWLKRLAGRTKWTFDEAVLETLEPPIRFIPVVAGAFFAFQVLGPVDGVEDFADRLVRSLIAFTIFWAFYRAIEPVSDVLHRFDKLFTPELVEWMVRALKVLIIVIGAAAVLEVWGIQVGPIIAGFGLLGVAVALGAQDLFKNLIAGLLILGERRFKKGDWILVDGVVEGTVESIGFRSTVVRRFDKAPVMVPNARLSDTAVVNFSEMTHRRIKMFVGVEYGTTIDQLRQIRDGIEAYIQGSDEFASPPEVTSFVRIDRFSDSSIDLYLYCFTKTTVWLEWLEIKERLHYKIKEIVEGAGTGFAFPSQSLYVESLPGEAAEIYVPPTGASAPPAPGTSN